MEKTKEVYPEIEIEKLKPYENNARLHTEKQIEQIVNSIKEFGFITPVIIDENDIILVGHGRTEAAKRAGLLKVPYRRIEGLTLDQKRAYILADNKLSDIAGWDEELLKIELENIELDMSKFGFDDFVIELDEEEEPKTKEDTIPEAPKKARAKLGDIWKLGTHRLMCGDSTDVVNINLLMDGKKADLLFCDPPYGMKKEKDGVLNDNLNYDELLEFNKAWIIPAIDKLKDNASFYCWGNEEPLMDIYSFILKPLIKRGKITFKNLITWDKGTGQGQMSSESRCYSIATEKCIFCMLGEQNYNNNSDNFYESFEPVRAKLEAEIKKIGESDQKIAQALGYKDGRTVNHWYSVSQFSFPTDENIKGLKDYAKTLGIEIFKDADKIKKEYEKIKKGFEAQKNAFYSTRAYFNNVHDNMNDVWHFTHTSEEERELTGGHATPKPLNLCERAIKTSSKKSDIVLDLFGGSGSTLIACEQLGRTCYMMELEPKYVDVIIKRWETITGQKAELL